MSGSFSGSRRGHDVVVWWSVRPSSCCSPGLLIQAMLEDGFDALVSRQLPSIRAALGKATFYRASQVASGPAGEWPQTGPIGLFADAFFVPHQRGRISFSLPVPSLGLPRRSVALVHSPGFGDGTPAVERRCAMPTLLIRNAGGCDPVARWKHSIGVVGDPDPPPLFLDQ